MNLFYSKATLLSLPASIISQLGLRQVGERDVETSAGITKGRIFASLSSLSLRSLRSLRLNHSGSKKYFPVT